MEGDTIREQADSPAPRFRPKVGCRDCPRRPSCEEPCRDLQKALGVEEGGKRRRVLTGGLHPIGGPEDQRKAKIALVREALDTAVKGAKSRRRKILEKFFWRGMTQRQIAADMGLTRGAVCVILHRILGKRG
jgi:RNA polymerase sigma factor (sigma-70 family)